MSDIKSSQENTSVGGFDLLQAWAQIPDQKYDYVKCWLYKKDLSKRIYIRADVKLFKNKIMRLAKIKIDGDEICGYVSVKEVQAHPVSGRMVHVDLFLIEENSDEQFRVMMPIKYVDSDKSPGIKLGGFLYQTSRAIEVKTTPKRLVPFVSASIAQMKAGDSIRVDAISFPEGVTPIRMDISIAKLEGSKGS